MRHRLSLASRGLLAAAGAVLVAGSARAASVSAPVERLALPMSAAAPAALGAAVSAPALILPSAATLAAPSSFAAPAAPSAAAPAAAPGGGGFGARIARSFAGLRNRFGGGRTEAETAGEELAALADVPSGHGEVWDQSRRLETEIHEASARLRKVPWPSRHTGYTFNPKDLTSDEQAASKLRGDLMSRLDALEARFDGLLPARAAPVPEALDAGRISGLLAAQTARVEAAIGAPVRLHEGYFPVGTEGRTQPGYYLTAAGVVGGGVGRDVSHLTYQEKRSSQEGRLGDPGFVTHPQLRAKGVSTLLFLKALSDLKFTSVGAGFVGTNRNRMVSAAAEHAAGTELSFARLEKLDGTKAEYEKFFAWAADVRSPQDVADRRARLIAAYFETPFGKTMAAAGFSRVAALLLDDPGDFYSEGGRHISVAVQHGPRGDSLTRVFLQTKGKKFEREYRPDGQAALVSSYYVLKELHPDY
ncbi:MAG: hypothetical protein ACHQ49_16090 [Elusimicrobiota bacterium]